MITITKLIQISPFPEDVKRELLAAAEGFSAEKEFEVAETCWALISLDYQNQLQYKKQQLILNAAKEKKGVSELELKQAEDELLSELTRRINEVSTEEDLQEIREKIANASKPASDRTIN